MPTPMSPAESAWSRHYISPLKLELNQLWHNFALEAPTWRLKTAMDERPGI